MVKNTQGGSSHKKFARKHTGGSVRNNNKLRVSEDEGEIYSIVTKMLGNGMFHCFCIDGYIRLGHIRGKFTGRGKRDNIVEIGKWVLIGLREWDVPSENSSNVLKQKEKIQHCDLLEVYSDIDKHRLRETVQLNWQSLDNNDVSRDNLKDTTDTMNEVVFGTERDFEREQLIAEMNSVTAEKITFKLGDYQDNKEEEINIDDI